METILKSLAIGLSLITGLQAMEVESGNLIPQGQTARELTATEKKNAYKMWLLKEHLVESNNEGTLPEIPRDIQTVIGQTLHDLCANPVLDGELKYEGVATPFKIRNLLKEDGCIDLSKPIFGDSSKYLLITTDLEAFFNVDEKSIRLIILIALKSLIEEKIGSSANPFEPIMANWDSGQAPIGIFYRAEWEKNLFWYDYLTSVNLSTISKNSLYKNWRDADVLPSRGPSLRSRVLMMYTQHAKNFMFILT